MEGLDVERAGRGMKLVEVSVDAFDQYYLVHDTSKNDRSDGAFKNIEVKVKGINYGVAHRAD